MHFHSTTLALAACRSLMSSSLLPGTSPTSTIGMMFQTPLLLLLLATFVPSQSLLRRSHLPSHPPFLCAQSPTLPHPLHAISMHSSLRHSCPWRSHVVGEVELD